jgi:diguanylate cyclase (GGDEF)-like protein/PAS domain S-box-containing protein
VVVMTDVRAAVPAHAPVAAAVLGALDDPVLLLVASVPGAWRIAWVNEAYERVTGWGADEVVGEVPGHLLGPLSDPDLLRAVARERRETGAPVLHHSCILQARDGSPLLCDLRAGGLPSEPGEPEWGWAVLHLATDHYRTLLENISDTVCVLDGDGVIRYASPSAARLGMDPETLLGVSPFDLMRPEDREHQIAHFRKVAATPGVHGPTSLTIPDGRGGHQVLDVVLNNRLADPAVRGVIVTARSATDRLVAEEELARRERRFRALVQHSSDFVVLVDSGGICRYASPAVDRLLGQSVEGLHYDEGAGFLGLLPASANERLGTVVDDPSASPAVEVNVELPDGTTRWLHITATNLLDDPDVEGIIVHGSDVTERKRADAVLAAELDVLQVLAESHTVIPVIRRIAQAAEAFLPGGRCSVGVMDGDGVVRHPAAPSLPPSLVALLDAEPADGDLGSVMRTSTDWLVVHDVTADPAWREMGPMAKRHGLRACWWFPVHGDDGLLGALTVFLPAPRGPHPAELPLLERLRHLTQLALERNRFEARLRDQAVHDALTKLPNRTLLLDRVEQALELGDRRRTHTAVLFVDLDQFKIVNDSLGHAKGDELLRQVADRFGSAVRRGDTVGRFGGDEFLVVVEDVAGEAGAVVAAERLVAALAHPFAIDGAQVAVNASIGIALAGPGADAVGPDALVRNADAAMYRAKDSGRNQIAVFEDTLHAELVRRYEVEQGLRGAVERDELVVLFQPRVRLSDGRLSGVEALLRWDRPGHGLVGADEIIPVAEETGLIVPLGAHVLRVACEQAVRWDASASTAGLSMSVNLSARQLADADLVPLVERTLGATGLAPRRLCLEVTESALARDPQGASAVLTALKRLGVQLAIDDFGTGYATLDYVRRFSMADELKIDRSFVAGLGDLHSPDAAIVSAAIVLADALGFTTVAEGVETPEQLAVLRRLGCETAQGWWFGRPVPADQIG